MVCDPFLAPFLLVLNLVLGIQCVPFPQLGQGLTFPSAFYMLESAPSLTHSCGKYAHCGPPIYKNCKTAARESIYTSTTNESCLSCAFPPPDRSHTRVWVPQLVLPVPLVSTSLAPLLPSSSRILDNYPYHGFGL